MIFPSLLHLMELKLEHTEERLTRRAGLILVNRSGDTLDLRSN